MSLGGLHLAVVRELACFNKTVSYHSWINQVEYITVEIPD
jgi:hypothetical protein